MLIQLMLHNHSICACMGDAEAQLNLLPAAAPFLSCKTVCSASTTIVVEAEQTEGGLGQGQRVTTRHNTLPVALVSFTYTCRTYVKAKSPHQLLLSANLGTSMWECCTDESTMFIAPTGI